MSHLGRSDLKSRERLTRSRTTIVLVALVLAATMAFPSGAGAGNFAGITSNGSNPCESGAGINRMDGGTTKVMYKNLEPLTQLALNESVWASYDPINLGIVIVTSGFDIQARDWDYTNFCGYTWNSGGSSGIRGLYNCFRLKTSGVYSFGRDKARIRYDTSYLNAGLPSYDRTALACHEFGHGVGLKHSSADCMKQGNNKPSKSIGSHNVAEINANYVEP